MIAALAGFVHDRECTANYDRDDDNDSYYGSVHCNLPCEPEPQVHKSQSMCLGPTLLGSTGDTERNK
jgi:hypothetical protein